MDRVINDIHLTNIGDALRKTMGEDSQFPPEDMGEAVKVSNEVAFGNGYEEGEEFGYNTGFADGDELGYQAGMEQGYNNGKADGIEEGKKVGKDEWWDTYLSRMKAGRPVNYLFAGPSWNGNTFYPTQDIVPKDNATALFAYFSWNANVSRIDLAQRLEDCGVSLDLSQCSTFADIFRNAWVTRIPKIDMSNNTRATGLSYTFSGTKYLTTIDELILRNDGSNTFSYTFNDATALENLTIGGVIGQGIGFGTCPLSANSIKSVITALKDYSGTSNEYKYTVTFKTSAFNALESEGATAEYNGTACTWAELVGFKKWNLTKA